MEVQQNIPQRYVRRYKDISGSYFPGDATLVPWGCKEVHWEYPPIEVR